MPGTVLVFDELFGYPEYRENEIKALWECMAMTMTITVAINTTVPMQGRTNIGNVSMRKERDPAERDPPDPDLKLRVLGHSLKKIEEWVRGGQRGEVWPQAVVLQVA